MRSPDLLGALLVDRYAAAPAMGPSRPVRPVPGRGLARFGSDGWPQPGPSILAARAAVDAKPDSFSEFVDAALKIVTAFRAEAAIPRWTRDEGPSVLAKIDGFAKDVEDRIKLANQGNEKKFFDLSDVFSPLSTIRGSSYAGKAINYIPQTVKLIDDLDAQKVKVARDVEIYDPKQAAGTAGKKVNDGLVKIPKNESYYDASKRLEALASYTKPFGPEAPPGAPTAAPAAPAAAAPASAPPAAAPSIPAYTMPAATAAVPAAYAPSEGPAPGTEPPPAAAGDRPAWLLPALIATAAAGVALIALPIGATAAPVTPIRQTGSRARNLDYGSVTSDAREGRMIRGTLRNLESDARAMRQMLEDDDDLPQWVHSKVQTSADRVNSAHRYLRAKIQASK